MARAREATGAGPGPGAGTGAGPGAGTGDPEPEPEPEPEPHRSVTDIVDDLLAPADSGDAIQDATVVEGHAEEEPP